jgi:hypothetical protein
MGDLIDLMERKAVDVTKGFSDALVDVMSLYANKGLEAVLILSIMGIIIKKNKDLVTDEEFEKVIQLIDSYEVK